MLSVKNIVSISSGSGGDNSLWAEIFNPKQGVAKPTDVLYKSCQLEEDIMMHTNVYNNAVIPSESFNTESYSINNPFVKAVVGYTTV